MNKQKTRNRKEAQRIAPTPFEQARDEMFQHIMKCGVIGAHEEDQEIWFDDTIAYLADRYHELNESQLGELRVLGERFSQPAKAKQAG